MLLILLVFTFVAVLYVLPFAVVFGALQIGVRQLGRVIDLAAARPVLREAARGLGLRSLRRSVFFGDRAGGALAGFEVTLEQQHRLRRDDTTQSFGALRIELQTPLRRPERLALGTVRDEHRAHPRGRGDEPVRALTLAHPLRTADPQFDRTFSVGGRAAGVAARLDAELRRRLLALADKVDLELADGRLVALTRRPFLLPRSVELLVEDLADTFRALLDDDRSVPARLLENGTTDPLPAVRYQNLELLLRDHPATPEAKAALAYAWGAEERGIRYLAAVRTTSEEATRFLFETVEAEEEPVALRTMALRHLARRAEPAEILPLLRAQLAADHPALQTAAIEILGRLQDTLSVPALVRLGRSRVRASTRSAIARALGAIGSSAAEEHLVELVREDDLEVKMAAIAALGRVASPRVLGLLGRIRARAMALPELADAAAAAMARIEARVGPVERGRLSVIEPGGGDGALSLAPATRGALALAEPSEPTR